MNKSSFHNLIRYLCVKPSYVKQSCAIFLILCFLGFLLLRFWSVPLWPSLSLSDLSQTRSLSNDEPSSSDLNQPRSLSNNKSSPYDLSQLKSLFDEKPTSCDLSQPQSLFSDEPVIILYWGFPWRIPSYAPPECQTEVTKEGYCVVTHDKRRIKDAYAVLFHYTTMTEFDIPWRHYRGSEQLFIWWSKETPSIIAMEGKDLRLFDNFFNWTWTYRRDSDVISNYGQRSDVIENLAKGRKVVDQIIAKKKKLAIWIVSQCNYTIGARMRLKYANELRVAGLDFDGYGKCFNQELPRDNYTNILNKIKTYKFYFAFENGWHCKDYITEKFWVKALANDVVPVVWGPTKDDILSVAPLDSFIYAEDYKSPQKLAEYLKFLDSNDQEYRKYFRWREDESMTDEKMIKMVSERYPKLDVAEKPKTLCEKLIENRKQNGRKIIKSLFSNFVETNPPECSV